jgi:hypothetical protein
MTAVPQTLIPSPWQGRGTRNSGSQGVGRVTPSPLKPVPTQSGGDTPASSPSTLEGEGWGEGYTT